MVMMFVRRVVSVLDGILVIFLLQRNFGVGVFVPTRTLIVVKL